MGRMTGVNEDWYVNFGEFDRGRDWSDARDLGFVSAGWGLRYSDPLRKVPIGANPRSRVPASHAGDGQRAQAGVVVPSR